MLGRSFFCLWQGYFYGWSLLLAVNCLGLLYLRLRFGLLFFCLRWKIGLSFLLMVPPRPEIRFGLLCLRFPRPETGFGLFCLRFPDRKQKNEPKAKNNSIVSKKDTSFRVKHCFVVLFLKISFSLQKQKDFFKQKRFNYVVQHAWTNF